METLSNCSSPELCSTIHIKRNGIEVYIVWFVDDNSSSIDLRDGIESVPWSSGDGDLVKADVVGIPAQVLAQYILSDSEHFQPVP